MEWAIVENTHDANREAMLMDLMQVRRIEYKFSRIEAMHKSSCLFLLDNLHLTLQLKPGDEFYEVQSACEKIETSEQTKQRISNRGENILSGLEVEISLKPDQWTRILGQTVLVILILGNSTIRVDLLLTF